MISQEANRRRNLIAALLTSPPPEQPLEIFPHSPTSSFAPGNLFEGNTPAAMPGYSPTNETTMTSPTMAIDLPSSGNLFEGSFDPLGNAIDPGSPTGPVGQNGPPGSFGLFDPGNPGVFSPGPLGDFTTGRANPFSDAPTPMPEFTPEPGVPTDFNPAASGDLADLGNSGQGDEDGGSDSGSDGASGGVG
jgi:hypothetical protein